MSYLSYIWTLEAIQVQANLEIHNIWIIGAGVLLTSVGLLMLQKLLTIKRIQYPYYKES